jgi:hypothetical protein
MIQDLIFFQNIELYNKCETEARRQKMKTNYFIAECVKKILEKNNIIGEYKKPLDLWFDCAELSKRTGQKISDIIEAACQYELCPPSEKASFWDKFKLPVG